MLPNLGSVLSTSSNIDDDVNARLGQANAGFVRLKKRLWGNHGITLATKVAVYKAVVVTTLQYGCKASLEVKTAHSAVTLAL